MSKAKAIKLPTIECHDCWSEALMAVGIYATLTRIPNDKRRKLIAAYENYFYDSHELQNLALRK